MLSDETKSRVILARPQGFCAGVVRAVEIVERALELYGPPVYVRHEIVHNRHVVERLSGLGAIFVKEVDEIPEGALTIFSAHGVSRKVENAASVRGLDVIDATCPLVRRVHKEAQRYSESGFDVILVGHNGHAEVEGTRGQVDSDVHVVETIEDVSTVHVKDEMRVAFVTQTTLSLFDTEEIVAALRKRFPNIVGPDTRDICYATQNRQMAVLELAKIADVVLVVGSSTSSNATRLAEIAAATGVESYLVDGADKLNPEWVLGHSVIGVTAGASTPEEVVSKLVARIGDLMPVTIEDLPGKKENVHFRIPERLARPVVRVEPAVIPAE